MQKLATALPQITPQSSRASNRQTESAGECPHCTDGWILVIGEGVKQCECLRLKILRRSLDKIPAIYSRLSLDTIQPDAAKHPLQADVIATMRAHSESSFAFFGRNGCGKSLFGWLLYRKAIEAGRSAFGLPLSELLAQYRTFEKDNDKLADVMPSDLRQNKRRYLIFLDEIEKARPSEFAGEMLFRLIDAAYSFDHQLIVTTNTTAEKLSAHWSENGDTYGASIVRRILEMEDGYEVPMF